VTPDSETVPPAAQLAVSTAVASDVGCHRDGNEDAGLAVVPHDPEVVARRGVLVVVADGMGGHSAGEVASRLAVETMSRRYYEGDGDPAQALAEALAAANRAVFEAAQKDRRLAGMGTTCTAVAVRGRDAFCAHVGDSRLYLSRGGAIYRLTEDHSAVREMVSKGLITAEEASRHADRNVLLRAVGTRERVDGTIWPEPLPLRDGDVLIACTDGLHDLVSDEELRSEGGTEPPSAACARLVALARARGGYDNITAAVVRLSDSVPGAARQPVTTREIKALP